MSTPAAAYERPSAGIKQALRGRGGLELHLVHLELLRHRHRIRAVEARPAELLRRTASDRTHQSGDGQVLEAVRTEMLANLLHRAAEGDQLLGRPDVDTHEAWKAHRWAGDAHVDLLRAGGAQPFDDPLRRGAADDRVVHRDQALALDRSRQGIELEHDPG